MCYIKQHSDHLTLIEYLSNAVVLKIFDLIFCGKLPMIFHLFHDPKLSVYTSQIWTASWFDSELMISTTNKLLQAANRTFPDDYPSTCRVVLSCLTARIGMSTLVYRNSPIWSLLTSTIYPGIDSNYSANGTHLSNFVLSACLFAGLSLLSTRWWKFLWNGCKCFLVSCVEHQTLSVSDEQHAQCTVRAMCPIRQLRMQWKV